MSDARLKADAIIGEAKNKADEIIADTAEACKGYIYNSKADTDKAVLDLEARAKTVAELDARKLQLSAKAQILDRIFARTLDKLKNLDKERYTALVFAMLQNAEDGDEVVISQREKDIVTKESLEKFANEKGITLTLCDELGDFDGAINQYDKILQTKTHLLSIPFIYSNRKSYKMNKGLAYYNKGVAYKQKSV